MNNHRKSYLIVMAAAALIAACGDIKLTDNPARAVAKSVGFDLQLAGGSAAAAPFSLASATDASSGLSITTATINVREIAFKTPAGFCAGGDTAEVQGGADSNNKGKKPSFALAATETTTATEEVAHCSNDGFVVVEGPFRINLLTGESVPSLDNISIYAATYPWVDLRLETVTDTADPMNGASIDALGEYSQDSTFSVHIGMDIPNPPIRIKPAGGIVVAADGNANISVGIAASDWFAGTGDELAACAAQAGAPITDAVLQVTGNGGGSCDSLNGKLRQNFIGAGEKASVSVRKK